MNWQMSLSLFECDEFLVQLSVESTNFLQMSLLWVIVCGGQGCWQCLDWTAADGGTGGGEDESEEKEVMVTQWDEE